MHASSMENMYKCFSRYIDNSKYSHLSKINVVDLGGTDINGSYKTIFSDDRFEYKTMDIANEEDVDIIITEPYKFPLKNNSVNILISGQTFEHAEFFWLLFEEMIRIIKKEGFVFLIAPSSGPDHKYPVDCYRFYPDSYNALAKYTNSVLIDCWLDERGPWKDLVGVFSKTSFKKFQLKANQDNYLTCAYAEKRKPKFKFIRQNEDIEMVQGSINYLEVLKSIHHIKKPELYFEIGVRNGSSLALSNSPSIAIDPQPELKYELKNHLLRRWT